MHRCQLIFNSPKSISERPESVNNREEEGHWEIDLVVGKQGTKPVILTLVERKTRKSLYVLAKNKTQKEVIAAIKRSRKRGGDNFDEVFKSITADNGSEFLDSEAIKGTVEKSDFSSKKPMKVVRFHWFFAAINEFSTAP